MHRFEYKKLSKDEIKITTRLIRNTFARYCDEDIIFITDKIQYRMDLYDDDDKFYNTIDHYKGLQNAYNELKYHHHLYKIGTTRKDMFLAVCNEEV